MTADQPKPAQLYMVFEVFKNKDPVPIYRRFRDKGRMMPEGLSYVSSWIDDKLERCYQLMETHDRALLDEWIARWSDLVDFEVYPVLTSKEVVERIAPASSGARLPSQSGAGPTAPRALPPRWDRSPHLTP